VQLQFFHETAPEKEDSLVPIKQQEYSAINLKENIEGNAVEHKHI
jgi:hypothetical protein